MRNKVLAAVTSLCALLIIAVPAAAAEKKAKFKKTKPWLASEAMTEEERLENCPWVPRSGTWRFDAGKMSVGGLFTPFGGDKGGPVEVAVFNCGERIQANMGGDFGIVVFEITEEKFPGRDTELSVFALRKLLGKEGFEGATRLVQVPEALIEGPLSAPWIVWLDETTLSGLKVVGKMHHYSGSLELEPPPEIRLFRHNVYKAQPIEDFFWYLNPATQNDMYSMTTFKGWLEAGQRREAPAHQQFHRWKLRKVK